MKVFASIQILLLLAASMIPEGRWVIGIETAVSDSCCCSAKQHAGGACCCNAASTEASAASKSCCGTKSDRSDTTRKERKTLDRCGAFTQCPCGSESDVSVIVHAPRTFVARVIVARTDFASDSCVLLDQLRRDLSFPPETPPPRASLG